MKYIGTYSNDTDIATKAKVDAKQDKVLANGILQGDGAGTISAAETQEVELVELTKADVGLGNVDNTSDANKPISTATQTALNGKQATITGGASTITSSNLAYNKALVSDEYGKVASSVITATELGYLDGVTSNIQTQLNGKLSTAPVTSVNNKTGAVELVASDVGAQPTITANGFLKGDGSGGVTAEKPVYVVTMTSVGQRLSSDKTAKQIYDVYSDGRQVVALFSNVITPMTVCLRDGEGTTDSPYSYTIIFDGPSSQQNVNQPDRGYFNNVIYAYGLTYSGNSFNMVSATSVPTDRTINNKALSADISLNAADVNAVGLTGDQTIAGDKTFSGGTTFDSGFIVKGGSIFTGQQNFKNGMAVGGQTFYKENSTVDFTNATVTGLPGLLPTVTTSDNGKFLRVVNGAWAAATVENANGVSF